MLVIVELASALREPAVARAAYEALRPFAELPIMASLLAVVCFGSTHRLLGRRGVDVRRARSRGRAPHGGGECRDERLGHRPAAIQARAELGLARIARGQRRRPARGRALVEEAIAAAEAAGMGIAGGAVAYRADRWRPDAPVPRAGSARAGGAARLLACELRRPGRDGRRSRRAPVPRSAPRGPRSIDPGARARRGRGRGRAGGPGPAYARRPGGDRAARAHHGSPAADGAESRRSRSSWSS